MNLTRRPVYEKPAKAGRDPGYLARLHDLPCCICDAFGMRQSTPTEAHHIICGRGGNRKTPDDDAIPICRAHHRTGEDGFLAVHKHRKAWVEAYGLDTDYVAATRERVGA